MANHLQGIKRGFHFFFNLPAKGKDTLESSPPDTLMRVGTKVDGCLLAGGLSTEASQRDSGTNQALRRSQASDLFPSPLNFPIQ